MNSSHLFYLLPPIFLPDNRFGRYAFMWFAGNAKVDGLVQCKLQLVDLVKLARELCTIWTENRRQYREQIRSCHYL